MLYTFYVLLLIAFISNAYFGIYKEMYSVMYAEVINGLCMTILLLAIAFESYKKSKNKKS